MHYLDEELKRAGNHPNFAPLLTELVKSNPALAAGLARHILQAKIATPLVREMPLLLWENSALTESERLDLLAAAARSPHPGAAASVVAFIRWRSRQANYAPSNNEAQLLLELAKQPDPAIAATLLDFCGHADGPALMLACQVLETMPVSLLPPSVAGGVWEVLVPYRKRAMPLPEPVVARLFQELVAILRLELHQHWQQFHELAETRPWDTYTLLRNRILQAAKPETPKNYVPLPEGYDFTIRLPGLTAHPDFSGICNELWARVLNRSDPCWHQWRELWQAVVLTDNDQWLPRMLREAEAAKTAEELSTIVLLPRFDGSLMVFRFPDLTRTLLKKAQELGGAELLESIHDSLGFGCGPMVREYAGGVLEKDCDYVEAEAVKAAEAHASDPILGPFYRWIVQREQEDRLRHKARSDAEMAALD